MAKRTRTTTRIATDLIHAGQAPDPATGGVVVPLNLSTTFAQDAPNVHKGFDYSRAGNPTRAALEEAMRVLERGAGASAFSSGMAALTTLTNTLSAGDHVVSEQNVYGGTVRYFSQVASRFGVEFTFVDASDPANVERAMRETTKLVHLETPTNPNLRLADIAAVSDAAHEHGAIVSVDNTFASPYLQRPLELGADVVLHSATKYIGGHSDVLAGILVCKDADLAERVRFLQKSIGAVCSPFDAFLLLRGLKTLHVRMDRTCENAARIAETLADHPRVAAVNYPGLASHPQRALARRQMRAPGGMLSFELKGGGRAARKVLMGTTVWTLAESLGAVESLISHPASMTHASVPKAQREKAGVTDGLVRLSVGIEDADDLVDDLRRALR
ncbi:MAG TPA: PLP-dependent aspartate aminotransferase family protein [Candidatus Thermoplasmatota archaeon]|nr:PLP-dependent aspartate aminotransferase family protein [Candidatus Thermoplasmatota archaeon]